MRDLCRSEALSAYLDGVLAPGETEALEDHLKVCDRCREELEAFRQVRGLFQEWEPAVPRAFFVERLNRQLHVEAGSRLEILLTSWRGWAAERLVPAAMVAISVGAVLFLVHRLTLGPEPVTVDGFLNRSLDQEVLEFTTLAESDLSKDRVLDIVLAGNAR